MGSIKEVLASSRLFGGLTDAQLDGIVCLCREEVYEAGASIFTEGEVAKNLYLIEEGKVVLEIALRLGAKSQRRGLVDVLTKGQVFGWSAVAESPTWTMSAGCIERAKVIVLDAARLESLFKEDYPLGYEVTKRLVDVVRSRLTRTRDTLAHVISITSHDLKSPLAAVESYHQVMLGGYAGEITEKQKNMLLRSSERIKGLLNLIDNILDISRLDARDFSVGVMSLLIVAENSSGIVQPLAEEKGVQLKFEVPEELPLITGAPDRLLQVFNNLLGNAVKFTPAGGTITLRVSEVDDHVLVEVMDTGIGISPEELPKLFNDFYRGIRVDVAGAGLGLAIARKIVEAHSGKIWAESPCPESGVGSKFSFTLPKNPSVIQSGKKEVRSYESRD